MISGGLLTIQLSPKILKIYNEDICLLTGKREQKVCSVQTCNTGSLFLRDFASLVSTDGSGETHLSHKFVW